MFGWDTLLHTLILYSKIPPKRPQITPDHTRSSREHAFWAYFLTGSRQTRLFHCPTRLPKPREPPYTSNGLSVAAFRFKKEKKTYYWSQLGKIDPKDYRNKDVS